MQTGSCYALGQFYKQQKYETNVPINFVYFIDKNGINAIYSTINAIGLKTTKS